MVKAYLKNYRQSPRKVRLVVDLVRGKKVNDALDILEFTSKRASLPVIKLIQSAVANAKNNHKMPTDNLFIKEITVDEGPTLKRWRPRARGSASQILKRTSHVKVILDAKGASKTVESTEVVAKIATPDTVKKTKTVAKKTSVKKNTKTKK